MNKQEQNLLDLFQYVLDNGKYVPNRTGTGTYRIIDAGLRFDLSDGSVPFMTTKKVNVLNPIGEMLWMLAGKTDLKTLRHYQNKPEGAHTIWSDDFEKFWKRLEDKFDGQNFTYRDQEEGGRIYGINLRHYEGIDQLRTLLRNIKAVKDDPTHPAARRLKCEWWSPIYHLDDEQLMAALPACHTGFQCIVDGDKLTLKYFMRSNDMFLGKPYNLAAYGWLLHVLAHLTGLKVGELIYDGTDVHIYENHIEQVKTLLSRKPKPFPKMVMPKFDTLEELLKLTAKDFIIIGYEPEGFIAAPQAS